MARPLAGTGLSWVTTVARGRQAGIPVCSRCLDSHSMLPRQGSPGPSTFHQTRSYQSYLRVNSAKGGNAGRIALRDGKHGVYGVATSRGPRPTQEDTYSVACVHVDPIELRHSLQVSKSRVVQEAAKRWDPFAEGEEDAIAGQVVWFGCFDGHGSQAVSAFLKEELHPTFEEMEPNMATDTVRYTRSLGGYFRRFTGGMASRWVRQEMLPAIRAGRNPGGAHHRPPKNQEQSSDATLSTEELDKARKDLEQKNEKANAAIENTDTLGKIDVERIEPPEEVKNESLTLAERATLTFLHMDRRIQSSKTLNIGGSTASVALLHSLDSPAQPWYSSQLLSVTSIHIGDTRMLLCPVSDGRAIPLTNYHHPDDRAEAERLRKVGAGLITDSFGEARWMGALANTRAFGDSQFKKAGVTPEPEVITQILKGDDFAFIIAFSDGIGGVVSDQEVVDLCRSAAHPHEAAKAVLRYAEALGSEDNATVMCIPLRGWGKVSGEDGTAEKRRYKLSKVDLFRDHRQ
jgi:protein phosphatase PTC6